MRLTMNLLPLMKKKFMLQILGLYTLTFSVILPLMCSHMKHSIYFSQWKNSDEAKDWTRKENDARLEKALDYFKLNETVLSAHSKYALTSNYYRTHIVALTIITASRNRHMVDDYHPMYLTQVLYKYLMLLSKLEQEVHYSIRISVCNVDFDPDSYHEVKQLSKFVKIFNRFHQMDISILHPLEKEKQDYVYCLNSSLSENADYILLVEDDGLPHVDFFPVLFHILDSHLTYSAIADQNLYQSTGEQLTDSTAYVKFYHPERLSVYSLYNPIAMVELVSLVCLFGPLLSGVVSLFLQPSVPMKIIMLTICLFIFLVCIAIGRPHIMEVRRIMSPYLYSFEPAPSCCTPAILYPRYAAIAIVNYMSGVTCGNNFGKDSVLDVFLHDTGFKANLVQPNCVEHIGMYSILHGNIVDPFLM